MQRHRPQPRPRRVRFAIRLDPTRWLRFFAYPSSHARKSAFVSYYPVAPLLPTFATEYRTQRPW